MWRYAFGVLTGVTASIFSFAVILPEYREFVLAGIYAHAALLLTALVLLALLSGLALFLIYRWMKRAFNADKLTVGLLRERINTITQHAASRNWSTFSEELGQLLGGFFMLGSTAVLYRRAAALLILTITAIGGTTGTILLMKQNEKLDQQILVAKQMASLNEIQLLKVKSDELESINELTNEISRALTPQMQAKIERHYGGKGELRCFPDQWESATASEETAPPFPWETKLQHLRSRVIAFLVGSLEKSRAHKILRGDLFEKLARSGIPFAAFEGAEFKGAQLKRKVKLENTKLSSASLPQASLIWANLSGVCAYGLAAPDAVLTAADFSNARLKDFWLGNAELSGANFRMARLEEGWVSFSLDSWYNFGGYDDHIDFGSYDLGWGDLLKPSTYRFWIMQGYQYFNRFWKKRTQKPNADVYDLERVHHGFRESDLSYADFSGATITGVSFEAAKLDAAKLPGASFQAVTESPDGDGEAVQTSFSSATLTNADFRVAPSSDLDKIGFTGTDLTNTIVDGLDFGANKTLKKSQLLKACICDGPMPKLKGATITLKRCKDNRYCKPPKS